MAVSRSGSMLVRRPAAAPTEIVVYPAPAQASEGKAGSGGDDCGFAAAEGFLQPSGLREYRPGDELKSVHWKASARHNRLQEKVFEPSQQKKVLLAVEVSQFEKANASESFERTLEVVGSLAVQSYQRGYALGIVTNGVVEGGSPFLSVGRSSQKLSSILEILARLKMRRMGASQIHFTKSWNYPGA